MRCRICGCTEDNACVDPCGQTCYWAGPGLCSFCAEMAVQAESALMRGLSDDDPQVQIYTDAEANEYLRTPRCRRRAASAGG